MQMKLDEDLKQLVERLSAAAGQNLVALVLHGSAVSDEFHPQFSDVNILAVVRELSAGAMQALSPVLNWWTGLKYAVPLFFTADELRSVADVFPIEMIDIKLRHRILYGDEIFAQLEVSMELHRVQLEHEIRTKLLFLREHYMQFSQDAAKVRHLMVDSVSNFLALFRHTLIAMGETPPLHKAEVAQRIAARLGFDPAPLQQLLDVRQHKLKPEVLELPQAFAAYLRAIETVVAAVDKL
jgi:hypothetical protein